MQTCSPIAFSDCNGIIRTRSVDDICAWASLALYLRAKSIVSLLTDWPILKRPKHRMIHCHSQHRRLFCRLQFFFIPQPNEPTAPIVLFSLPSGCGGGGAINNVNSRCIRAYSGFSWQTTSRLYTINQSTHIQRSRPFIRALKCRQYAPANAHTEWCAERVHGQRSFISVRYQHVSCKHPQGQDISILRNIQIRNSIQLQVLGAYN